jgi:anti-anti-sigma factor
VEIRTSIRSLGDGTRILTVVGAIDLHTAPAFQQSLRTLLQDSEGRVVVDFTECEYLDSTALHVIVQAERELNGRADKLSLVVPAPSVLKIFEVTGLAARLDIYPSLTGAVNGSAEDR